MAAWKVYRKNVTAAQGKAIVDNLIKNGKVWGKTVTSTNIGNKFTVHIK
jgi:hypothetical protein